jgi:hypothetical protein
MQNFHNFPTAYHSHNLDKHFESYNENTGRSGEHIYRDQKFTNT